METWLIFLIFILFLILYNISTVFHYYSRISFYYFTILLHGVETCITMIPSWLQGGGADYVIKSFYYWCKWTGVNFTVRGYEYTQIDGPAVYVCNHQSSLDVMTMSAVWPKKCVVMMKKILALVPFFNLGAYFSNTIFIDRSNRKKATNSIDYCVNEMKKRDLKLWVFPEGTRNREGGMLPFKKGAFNIAVRAQVPIVPVIFSDYRPFYSKPGKYFKNDGEVFIQVLPPITTEGLTTDDVPSLAEKVRSQMLKVYEELSAECEQFTENKRIKKLN